MRSEALIAGGIQSVNPQTIIALALQVLSWNGWALSLQTLIVSAPYLLEDHGGVGIVFSNVAQFASMLAQLLKTTRGFTDSESELIIAGSIDTMIRPLQVRL